MPALGAPATAGYPVSPRPTPRTEAGRMAKLYFYYSTMNAGKSTALLQAAHNYAERGLTAALFTARLDDRAGGRIASRIGIAADATRFDPGTDFWEALAGPRPACV